jgi:L-threonylcarbamoyladenylate synthase
MGHFIIHLRENDDPYIYLQRAAEIIHEGGIIGYPTDTVYGMGADPFNREAIQRILEIKQRDAQKGFPILIPDLEDAMKIGDLLPFEVKLTEHFWPGALTLVVPLKNNEFALDQTITGGRTTIALRIPSNPIIRGICNELKKITGFGGVIGTSANFSGEANISKGKQLVEEFSNLLDFIIETGECKQKIPSTVVVFNHNSSTPLETMEVLRQGIITKSQLESILKEDEKSNEHI